MAQQNALLALHGRTLIIEPHTHTEADKLLLIRVGDFYEAFGVDAVMLVEHAGLEIHAYHLRESNDADADTFTFAQFFSFLHTYDAHGLYIRKRKFFDLPRSLQIDVACRWCFVPCAVFLFGGQALLWFGLEQIDSGPAED